MAWPEKLRRYAVAFAELGPRPIGENLLYRFGLASGHYRRTLQAELKFNSSISIQFTPAFQPAQHDRLQKLLTKIDLTEADQILAGKFQPFGGKPAVLNLQLGTSPLDWTMWQAKPDQDIKDFWEPARFGWAVTLARAYHATADGRYAECLWRNFEAFSTAHPAYTGPQWVSGQEAALRLIHLCLAVNEMRSAPASTPERMQRLTRSLTEHAERIPPTLVYASAQQNNHLLSEAVGLITAAAFLPGHPRAAYWKEIGWKEFNRGILTQITADGTYGQQSVCYHRLMLSLALWLNAIRDREFSPEVLHHLQASSSWLADLIQGLNGHAPNLGSNDGSLILPLGPGGVEDYGPISAAAMTVFNGQTPDGSDELSAWLARPTGSAPASLPELQSLRRMDGKTSIGFLRTAEFFSRPSHADQLHFDLWWQGQNILRDPGTYSYNAPQPWQNGLAGTDVHNSLSVDGLDQMTRLGKFLWIDRADGEIISSGNRRLIARHNGYRHINLIHEREVRLQNADEWLIVDRLIQSTGRRRPHQIRLHWLLPDALPADQPSSEADWRWRITPAGLILSSAIGEVRLEFALDPITVEPQFHLYRKGELVYGSSPAKPTWGWESPTYGVLRPALALAVTCTAAAPVSISTSITLTSAGR